MLLQERKLQETNEQLIVDLKQKDKEIERLKKENEELKKICKKESCKKENG